MTVQDNCKIETRLRVSLTHSVMSESEIYVDSDGPASSDEDSDTNHRFRGLTKGLLVTDHNEASNDLYWSAKEGDLPKCQTLLAIGADVNYRVGVNNRTSLHEASLNGSTSLVKLLIEKGAVVNITDRIGFTPLHMASQEGHLATARLLVNSGARTDASQWQGFMPIHLAAQGNRHQILTYLVTEAGVSVNVVSTAISVL